MSAFSAAASDEDGDIISALREKLGRAHALCRIRSDRIRELEAMLRGASKVEQPQDHSEQYLGMVPPGWKLVPVEPTDDMLYDIQEFSHILPPRGRRIWSHMLAAAPQPPVVEPHNCTYQGGYLDGMAKGRRDAELDALETNPVAWLLRDANNHRVRFLEWTSTPLGYRGEWIKTPLYTRPQPRQPLTDEMVELGWELHGSSDAYQAWSLAVEWTERTHGIGGEA